MTSANHPQGILSFVSVFGSAQFSGDEAMAYRYRLVREWDADLPVVNFIGLNPSTADALSDDPTVRRCRGFARQLGFGKLIITNLFAWRATDPKAMRGGTEPVGPENDRFIQASALEAQQVVVCWGDGGRFRNRWREVAPFIPGIPACLGTTRSGQPKHPLYLAQACRLEPFLGFALDTRANTECP
ncbi:MAG: DUF1643 domain-containing protein [Candidatus Dormibacteraceae bacterium]